MKMGKKIKENAYEILVTLVCAAVFCFFVSCKQGYHMDELLSFELANAEFNPWIVPTQPEGRLAKFVHNEIDGGTFGETVGNLADTVKDVLENRGNSKLLTYTADVYEEPVWITSEQFQDYITVGRGDAFHYLSVYFNVKDDNHPPLHFMLLHTVSSLFQGRISPWMGCVINMAAVLWVMALLYRICRMTAPGLGLGKEGRRLGLMTALFYGLSTGAQVTVLLIRMYGVLTLWCVLYFYLIWKKWQDASFDRKNGRLILVTMLGFWTQYYFLFYCLLLAAVVSVCLGKEGRRRELFCFVRSMAVAALVGVLAFPFAIADVFSSGRGVEALGNLSRGLSGYGTRLLAFGRILLDRGIGYFSLCLVILLAAVLWAGMRSRRKGRVSLDGAGSDRKRGNRAFWWMLLFPVAGYFLLAARMSPYLVDRYIMPLFPFAALILMLAVFQFLGKIHEVYPERLTRKLTLTVCEILVVFQVFYLVYYDGSYLYKGYDLQRKCAGAYAEHPCICIYDGVGYYENLLEFTQYDRTLLLTLEELENRTDRESIAELDEVVLLVKGGVDEMEVLTILSEEYGFSMAEMMMRNPGVYGDEILVMRKGVEE
ncbi:MAG: hypothetical protein NC121_09480 [Blautia sp.]|nr:hypothetical protein [Blautia sp.]